MKFAATKNKATSIGTCIARGKFAATIRSSFSCWSSGHEGKVKEKMEKGIHCHSGTCMSRSSRSGPSSTGSQGSCWSPAAGKAPREECAKKFTADISFLTGSTFSLK